MMGVKVMENVVEVAFCDGEACRRRCRSGFVEGVEGGGRLQRVKDAGPDGDKASAANHRARILECFKTGFVMSCSMHTMRS